ncbi:aminotransferase class IV [bacterium]|jgi:branched-subunit amino acid aminotransferase/4-amino-4-deoxychorismate lyase|nr:aminotransferase class IV [bacterium]
MSVFPYCSLNLNIVSETEIPALHSDFGFMYGYGLFETILIQNRQPIFLEEHISRMQKGTIILDFTLPYSVQEIRKSINQLIEKNNVESGILNLYLTPGDRQENLSSIRFGGHRLLAVVRTLSTDYYSDPLEIAIREESIQRIKMDSLKTMACMKNMLEKKLSKGYDDVILFDDKKQILETPTTNVFFVKGNCLFAPKSPCIVPGIVSDFIIKNRGAFGVDCLVQEVFLNDISHFDEIFLTNSIGGVIFVKTVNEFPELASRQVSARIKHGYNEMVKKHTESLC